MPRAPIKQSDLIRYATALQKANVEDWRLEVEPSGKLTFIVGPSAKAADEKNDWD